MFTSFDAVLPTYEVITPQTKRSFLIKSMTVADEEKMKASLMNEKKILQHLNKCLYDAIAEKEPKFTLEKFLSHVTLKDREALLYGLYHITYDEIRNYTISCGQCSNSQDITINASDTFSINMYEGKVGEILKKRVTKDLKILKNVKVVIKQPTLLDENNAMKKFAFQNYSNELIAETLIIDKFVWEHMVEAKDPVEIVDRDEIVRAYLSLPAKDKKIISNTYVEEFGKYQIELKMQNTCTKCGNTEVIDIDLVDNFFRAMYQ
jgi:hypothetical protein